MIDFERFHADLDAAIDYKSGAQGGLWPMDVVVVVFKVLVLQAIYNLSNPQTEFQILDRQNLERFLRLDDGDKVPDKTTIWHYREALICSDTIKT